MFSKKLPTLVYKLVNMTHSLLAEGNTPVMCYLHTWVEYWIEFNFIFQGSCCYNKKYLPTVSVKKHS